MKRLLVWLLLVLTVGTAVCYKLIPDFVNTNFSVMLFALFVQLIGTCVALADVLLSTSDKPLSDRPAFWLAAGMLFYCCIFITGHIMAVFLGQYVGPYYSFFVIVANILMYGGFIACFATLRRQDRKLLQEQQR